MVLVGILNTSDFGKVVVGPVLRYEDLGLLVFRKCWRPNSCLFAICSEPVLVIGDIFLLNCTSSIFDASNKERSVKCDQIAKVVYVYARIVSGSVSGCPSCKPAILLLKMWIEGKIQLIVGFMRDL